MSERSERMSNILEIAEGLFSRQGYENTSMRQIAAEAGSGKASLYYYFKSKEEIFQEVLEKEASELLEKFNESNGEKVSFQEKLYNFLNIPLEIFQRHGNILIKFFFKHHDISLLKSRCIMISTKEIFLKKCHELIEEGINLGYIRRDLDVERLIKVYIFNLIRTLFLRLPGEPEAESMEDKKLNYEFMIEIMLKGITV